MKKETNISQLLNDFFHNRIHVNEIEEAIQRLGDEQYRIEVENMMKIHWNEENDKDLPSKKEFESLLNGIHHRINIINEKESPGISRRIFSYLSKVAAVLFIPLVFSTSYFLFKEYQNENREISAVFNEIFTPMAAKTRFLLPDSTVVWLNSGSKLRYPLTFSKKRREVSLVGEGYFEVKKNAEKPFVVKTDKLDVTALGTAFDVMAYPGDPVVKTTLVNGRVEVFRKKPEKSNFLDPSHQAVLYNSTGKMTVKKVDTHYYVSWKDGKLIFKSEPMEVVAHQLERWFNCNIHLEDKQLKKYRYTGTIEMETLREVLELLKITTPIQYTYNKNTREIWIKPS